MRPLLSWQRFHHLARRCFYPYSRRLKAFRNFSLIQHLRPSPGCKYQQWIDQLVDKCYSNQQRLIPSPDQIEYRHKMTYDFTYLHDHGTSHLGTVAVNTLCLAIYHFAFSICTALPHSFWSEMMVQHSRTGSFLIRITIDPSDPLHLEIWKNSVSHLLVDYLLHNPSTDSLSHSHCIESILYQQCLSRGSKPSKYGPYYCLFGDGIISHSTSISQIPIRVSCGTFCEPNLKMEQKQFEHIHRWISDLIESEEDDEYNSGSNRKQKQYVLIGKGRELIPYVLEIHHKLKHRLSLVIGISPCKNVHHDAQHNFATHLGSTPFHCYYSNHRDDGDMANYAQLVMDHYYEVLRNEGGEHGVIFMVTAGRNGLSRKFVEWIKSMDNVDRILYSSCNPKVTLREMEWFLEGENG